MGLLKEIISVFYPKMCVGCGRIIDDGEDFCDYCHNELLRNDSSKFCTKCGNKKENCECRKRVFHFECLTAPFETDGIAKNVMYAFKFHKKEHLAEVFAKSMALAVKQSFFDTCFDCIVCVPMYRREKMKRGYNQSELLGIKLAQILNLPFYYEALGCNKKKKPQHKTLYNERRENVKGIYFLKKPIKNKTVLLVDDIKSSGATLEECTLQLLEGGAKKVYCAVGCVTERKGLKNGN